MLPPIYNLLRAAPAVVGLVEDRIYRHGQAQKGVREPYVTWFQVVGTPENTLSETPTIDRCTIQIDVWCGGRDGDKQCETLFTAIRDALEPVAHMTSRPVDQRERETGLYRIAGEFDFWLHRG